MMTCDPTRRLRRVLAEAIQQFGDESSRLRRIAELRYDRRVFPTTGQYDWFSGRLLYCLLRHLRPETVVEVSMGSGYSTLFIALALKANGTGRVHTFELDATLVPAATSNFERFDVSEVVAVHVGDARTASAEVGGFAAEILFLDGLHTEAFCRWFIERWVLNWAPGALFHVHDVLPAQACVRRGSSTQGPLTRGLETGKEAVRHLLRRGRHRRSRDMLEVIRAARRSVGSLAYNGNDASEARFINMLTSLMDPDAYVYLHDAVDQFPSLDGHCYDNLAVSRRTERGEPAEWNESVWMCASEVQRVYGRIPIASTDHGN